MKDTWINHNTDKLMLFVLLVLSGAMVMHIVHHDQGDMQAMTWAEGAFSTILGALILILTGRISRTDNQTVNGIPPMAQPGAQPPTLTPAFPAVAATVPNAEQPKAA